MDGDGEPAVRVWRGRVVENVHRAVIVAVDARGKLLGRLGDPDEVVYLRSSAKPFQALPLVASGAAEALGLTDRELALAAASHGGEDRHVKAVEGMLAKVGVGPEALRCGRHRPRHKATARRVGEDYNALHHNCSGKHAGMLALAKHLGAPLDKYLDPASEGQKRIRKAVADVTGLRPAQVRLGTDGCSAPNFAVPLRAAALAYARLAAPDTLPRWEQPLRRVRDAMLAHPEMVSGEGRFDTDLMEAYGGRVVAKSGAEGVQCVGVPAKGVGLAIKVVDGSARAAPPATLRALRQLRVQGPLDAKRLEPHLGAVLTNYAGLEVGRLEARFTLRMNAHR